VTAPALSTAAIAVAAALVAVSDASAAVRRCGAVLSSDVVTAADELSAKKQALDQWSLKAKRLGSGFDAWRLAIDKALKCFPARSGKGFDCMAVGAPCTIQQNPNQEPVGKDGKGLGL